MSEMIGWIRTARDWVSDFTSIGRLRSQIDILKILNKTLSDEAAILRNEKRDLEKKVSDQSEEIRKLAKQVQELTPHNVFREHLGALFRFPPGGPVDRIAYCPKCRLPMIGGFGRKFQCTTCMHFASFSRLEDALADFG